MPEVRVEEVDEEFPKVNIACEMISFESNTIEKPYGNNSIAEGKLFEGLKRFMAAGFKGISVKTKKKRKLIVEDELEEDEELVEKKKKKKKKALEMQMHESTRDVEPVKTRKKATEKTREMVEHVTKRPVRANKDRDRGGR